MRYLALALSLLLPLGGVSAARAAEINVLAVGLVGNGFGQAVAAFTKQTGHTVKLPAPLGPLGVIVAAMDTQPADVVILPVGDLATHAAKFRPGATRNVGRVLFSLGVKANAVSPRIGSEAELKAALAGKTVLINDPATSLNGRMVKAVLDGPGYETVKQVAIPGNAAMRLAERADADYALNVLPEQLAAAPGVKVAGEIPASVGLRIDFGGGVTVKAAQPDAARDFLAFLAGPEAQALWKANGVASPIP